MKEYIPYVYLIKNKTTNLKYLGVRYAKDCHPDDLWVEYFTSSKLVKKLIGQFGCDDFLFKVIHQFPNDPESAILKEAYYFKFIKKKNDYLNITYSSGIQDLRINSKAGKVGGTIVYQKKIGIFRNEEERIKWASMGGKVSGKKQAELGLGFHLYKNNMEQHKINSSKGGIASGQFQNKEFQSEMGKRGGVKNKGSRWYTDGKILYKYTEKQQEELSFDDFLKQNPTFSKGKLKSKNNENQKYN